MTRRSLVYIMSHSFSGSTLLTYLLGTHPEIATIGELKATSMGDIEKYTCSCSKLITQCSFWLELNQRMVQYGYLFSFDSFGTNYRVDSCVCDSLMRATVRNPWFEVLRKMFFWLLPQCHQKRNDITAQCDAIISIICKLQEGNVFLDGSKDPIRLKHYLDADRWNIKVISLVRDGRGVANSFLKHKNVTMQKAIDEWLHTTKEVAYVNNMLAADQVMHIKYEDLCNRPDSTMQSLYDFIGIEANKGQLEFRNSENHILGNSMRLNSTSEIRYDDKWRKLLSAEQLALFEQQAGSLNRRLGYIH